MTTKIIISTIFTAFGSFIFYFLGGADTLLIVACSFLLIDLITGITKGAFTHSLDSKKGKLGILKKTMWLTPIIVAVLLDKLTHFNESGLSFRTAMLLYLVSNEGISIIENLEAMGIKMPKQIYAVLRKIKDEEPK